MNIARGSTLIMTLYLSTGCVCNKCLIIDGSFEQTKQIDISATTPKIGSWLGDSGLFVSDCDGFKPRDGHFAFQFDKTSLDNYAGGDANINQYILVPDKFMKSSLAGNKISVTVSAWFLRTQEYPNSYQRAGIIIIAEGSQSVARSPGVGISNQFPSDNQSIMPLKKWVQYSESLVLPAGTKQVEIQLLVTKIDTIKKQPHNFLDAVCVKFSEVK